MTPAESSENKQLLQQAFAALANGDSRPFVECLADDVVWTIIGTTSWSGTYRDKPAVLAELLAPLGARIAGRYRVGAHRFIAEDDLVVVEARGNNTTRGGQPYDNSYCWVCRLAGGKVRELTEYADTALVNTALGDRLGDSPG
ncbi:MAG TPA: nuclear transport factor 2 family protein [Thermoanaerobaculia bacterium]|nr:nuclear transport factor 2 family protein [Thermoanaerobaculia bacterium]